MLSCLTRVHYGCVLSHVRLFATPWTARLPCPWDSPGNDTGVGCHFLFQGIFLTQGSNPNLLRLPHWQEDSLPLSHHVVAAWSLSRVWLSATPWTAACHASPSFTISKSAQIRVHWIDDAIQPSLPLPPSSPPALNLSQHQGFFSNESALHIRWPNYWSFSFSISPSNEYSELISFRIGWFDLLAVQGTLKSLFQLHSLKANCGFFFGAQPSIWYHATP